MGGNEAFPPKIQDNINSFEIECLFVQVVNDSNALLGLVRDEHLPRGKEWLAHCKVRGIVTAGQQLPPLQMNRRVM